MTEQAHVWVIIKLRRFVINGETYACTAIHGWPNRSATAGGANPQDAGHEDTRKPAASLGRGARALGFAELVREFLFGEAHAVGRGAALHAPSLGERSDVQ